MRFSRFFEHVRVSCDSPYTVETQFCTTLVHFHVRANDDKTGAALEKYYVRPRGRQRNISTESNGGVLMRLFLPPWALLALTIRHRKGTQSLLRLAG